MSKKIRVIVDLELNEDALKEKNLTPEEILNGIKVKESDIIDGCEIFPVLPELDVACDFVLQSGTLVSKEFVEA